METLEQVLNGPMTKSGVKQLLLFEGSDLIMKTSLEDQGQKNLGSAFITK